MITPEAPSAYRAVETLALARLQLLQNQPEEALHLLEPLLHPGAGPRPLASRVTILALRTRVLEARGERDQVIAMLGEALRHAEPEGYVRTFVEHGARMAGLVRQIMAPGLPSQYVRRVLAAFDTGQDMLTRDGAAQEQPAVAPAQPLIEPLTEREQEVLRLLAAGASNQESADRLVITVRTAKKHVSNILAKLDASSRTQAVARARDYGLL